MANDVNVRNGIVNIGSTISDSTIRNEVSETRTGMTPEMWATLFRLVETYGKSQQRADAQRLKELVDQGRYEQIKPAWQNLRLFLGDFANVSKIVEVIDSFVR